METILGGTMNDKEVFFITVIAALGILGLILLLSNKDGGLSLGGLGNNNFVKKNELEDMLKKVMNSPNVLKPYRDPEGSDF